MKKSIIPYFTTSPVPDAIEPKYINLLTDYGLKSILNVQELAIEFLNDLLEGTAHIQKIVCLNKESIRRFENQETEIFELLCEDDQGQELAVEIQYLSREEFLIQTLFYSGSRVMNSFLAEASGYSDLNFQQKPTIFIGIMNFDMDESNPDEFRQISQLTETESKRIFCEKFKFIFIELPKSERLIGPTLSQGSANLNKWLYAFKKLHTLQKAPDFLSNDSFNRLLEIAEIANMTKQQKEEYEKSLRQLSGTFATHEASREEGFGEGRREGIVEGKTEEKTRIIKNLLNKGTMSILEIAEVSAVDEAYVLAIKDELDKQDK